jgi:hypothetical protein
VKRKGGSCAGNGAPAASASIAASILQPAQILRGEPSAGSIGEHRGVDPPARADPARGAWSASVTDTRPSARAGSAFAFHAPADKLVVSAMFADRANGTGAEG